MLILERALVALVLIGISVINALPIEEAVNRADLVPDTRNYPAGTTICFDDVVGCFSNEAPFTNTGYFLPIPPDMLKTEFLLFTPKNPRFEQLLHYRDPESVKMSNFDTSLPLKIVIHGFDNTRETRWMHDIKNAILKTEDVNCILVGWGNGSAFPNYNNASSNIRLVGRELGLLINLIRDVFFASSPKDLRIHCIGHSLGSHTCAYGSNNAKIRFNRITAMDPAGPFFENLDPLIRVDPTDADYVDVMHTNGGSLLSAAFGMVAPCGHVDFYPNGGKNQPGCPSGLFGLIGGVIDGIDPSSAAGCSHSRAYEFFIESITSSCPLLGYTCDSETEFNKGNCIKCPNNKCAVMGYWADKHPGRGNVYLATNADEPFCGHHHVFELKVSDDAPKTAGEVAIAFPTSTTDKTYKDISSDDDFKPGTVFKKVIVMQADLEKVKVMDMKFIKKAKPIIGQDPNATKLKFSKVSLYSVDLDETYSECFNEGRELETNKTTQININFNDCQL